ncbi:MAG: DUF58 domain-containing protein [Desulfobacterales bacterium]|nr:DUF58 domain-containing protein [Desulfobacterales bacterium]
MRWARNKKAGGRIVRGDLPLTLTRRWITLKPTRYGRLFILVLAAMLIGAVNYNNNLAMFLVFLLGSMGLVSALHTMGALHGIRILTVNARPAFAKTSAVFEIRVHPGKKRRWAAAFHFPGEEARPSDLAADGEVLLKAPRFVEKRGVLKPGPLTVSTVHPLGLFRCTARLLLNASCLIYPAPLPGESVARAGGGAGGDQEDDKGPGGDDFKGLKAYQPGDSLRRISWQAFSRGQGLVTKEFMGLTGSSLVLDFDELDEAGVERKLSRLCDMVLQAQHLNLVYGLELPGTSIEPDLGEAHGRACLRALALFAAPGAEPEAEP